MNGKKIDLPTIAAAIVVATTLISIGMWVTSVENLKVSVENLGVRVERLEVRVERLEVSVENLKVGVENLKVQVSAMHDALAEIQKKLGIPYFSTQVPPVLNERGKKTAEAIQAQGIASHYVERMFAETAGSNAYGIQQRAADFVREQLSDDLKERHPDEYALVLSVAGEERAPTESVIQEVVGIVLRDKVLERHGKTHQELVESTAEMTTDVMRGTFWPDKRRQKLVIPQTMLLNPFGLPDNPFIYREHAAVVPSSSHREEHSEESSAVPSPGSSEKIN